LLAKPANLTFEQAASVPVAAITALQAVRDKGRIQPGHRVLVNGAAGGVGTFAVQIAKALGAEVTGVCSSRNVELVRSIGADRVVDYTREDFTRTGLQYDLMVDMAGSRSLTEIRRILTPKGELVGVGGPDKGRWIEPLAGLAKMLVVNLLVRQRMVPMLAHQSRDDLAVVRELLESGKVHPVIDRTYPLSEVPEAIRYLETGHARGKVVITM
jgi:NADPH:quinone reductase-like Zn-dependent oxidoreductase